MGDFLARLRKLAAVRNVAVVLVSEATTRVRREEGTAVLRPGISTRAWEEGVGARVAVVRDWEGGRGGEGREGAGQAVRFVGVMKLGGVVYEGVGKVVAFTVENVGVSFGGGGEVGLWLTFWGGSRRACGRFQRRRKMEGLEGWCLGRGRRRRRR